jgi:hypothetical protein
MPNSAITCGKANNMMSALERGERAAHRGDSDIVFFVIVIVAIDRVCLFSILIILLLPTERGGQGYLRRITLTLMSPR